MVAGSKRLALVIGDDPDGDASAQPVTGRHVGRREAANRDRWVQVQNRNGQGYLLSGPTRNLPL